MTTVLEIWFNGPGDWGGRTVEDGEETGRTEEFGSRDDVIYAAAEAGIRVDEIRDLPDAPPLAV